MAVQGSHCITLEDRKKLTVDGVSDIAGYDEQNITAKTEMGDLAIHGSDLKIIRMSVDMGELVVEGNIISLTYSQTREEGGSFWSRVFR